MTLRIINFVYCKVNKRWSGKLWQRQWGLKREDNRVFPLVTINSSSDRDAGRDINPSAPLVTTVNSTGTEEPDAIRKLYPLIIENPEKSKSGNYISWTLTYIHVTELEHCVHTLTITCCGRWEELSYYSYSIYTFFVVMEQFYYAV